MKTQILRNILPTSLSLLGLVAASPPVSAQVTFRTIYTLGGVAQPGGLNEAKPGLFYSSAGSYYFFTINTKGQVQQIAPPPSATNFIGTPLPAANDRAYAAIGNGGEGSSAIFNAVSVTPTPGSMITYAGQNMNFALSQTLPNGTILGQATDFSNGIVSVATVDLSGKVTPVSQLENSNHYIYSNVIRASDGNYYGVDLTAFGGPPQEGSSYVFQVTPAGSMNRFLSLPNNALGIYAGWIIQGRDGNLYLETPYGGANGYGAMYQVTLSGQAKIIYSYVKGTSAHPGEFIQASDGNFYGATRGVNNGVAELYRLTLTGQYTTLHKMYGPDGLCGCSLIQASDGILYGTTVGGGSNGAGTVFALDAHLPKPAPQALAFRPSSGPPGTPILIWGNNLLVASVTFNGTPAAKAHSSGPNDVIATVPAGATTGPITVTTPGGASTTTASFTVR
jgi:uncharacterized repeat protein (TIGR03803 family)